MHIVEERNFTLPVPTACFPPVSAFQILKFHIFITSLLKRRYLTLYICIFILKNEQKNLELEIFSLFPSFYQINSLLIFYNYLALFFRITTTTIITTAAAQSNPTYNPVFVSVPVFTVTVPFRAFPLYVLVKSYPLTVPS